MASPYGPWVHRWVQTGRDSNGCDGYKGAMDPPQDKSITSARQHTVALLTSRDCALAESCRAILQPGTLELEMSKSNPIVLEAAVDPHTVFTVLAWP
jgi:hypothetical protein